MCILTKDGATEMGSRGVVGIRGVQGCVWYGRDEVKVPWTWEYLPRGCLCPHYGQWEEVGWPM